MKIKKLVISVSAVVGIVAVGYVMLSPSSSSISEDEQVSVSHKNSVTEPDKNVQSLAARPAPRPANFLEKPEPQQITKKVWSVPPIEPGHSRDIQVSSNLNHGHEVNTNNSSPRGAAPAGQHSTPKH